MTEWSNDWREAILDRVLRVANAALRYRWLLILPPVFAAAFTLFQMRNAKPTYTAVARFMTQSGGARPPNSALAAQLGLSSGSPSDATSPDFYIELITSRPVLEGTARTPFDLIGPHGEHQRQTLEQAYGSIDAAVGFLRSSVSTGIAAKTGTVSVSVTSSSPQLSVQIAQQVLKQLDAFNRQRRQSRAAAERQFTQARLATADSELRASESTLLDFYTKNRGFDRSPELRFEEQRLSREANRRQQVYASLAQAFEQAKIDEVRDTPVLTVLEDPQLPRVANSRNRLTRVMNAAIVAFAGAAVLALLLELFRGWRPRETDQIAQLRTLGHDALLDIRNPARAVRRLWS